MTWRRHRSYRPRHDADGGGRPPHGISVSRRASAVTANRSVRRWLKFNAVGAIGVAAQLAALGIFHGVLRLDYLTATALAVEAAVLHNFVWHERWTWRDRTGSRGGATARLLRFNLSAGLVSIPTNLALMRWL